MIINQLDYIIHGRFLIFYHIVFHSYTNYSFLKTICYYFQNLDVIFHNSRPKTQNGYHV